MNNQNSNASVSRGLGWPAEAAPKVEPPAATKHAPLRRWPVAELILKATLLGHPVTARTPGA